MLLLSFLVASSPFPQWRDIVAEGRLRRLRPSSIEGYGRDFQTVQMDLGQFSRCHFAAPELEEELGRIRHSDATHLTELLGKIQQLSERLFPGHVSFEHTFDPEEPTCEYTVFDVMARGSFSDYRDLIFQWHDEVERIDPQGARDFRLIVHPKP